MNVSPVFVPPLLTDQQPKALPDPGNEPDPAAKPDLPGDFEMTAAMLAERAGWSRHKAYRKMLAIEKAVPGVIRRRPGNVLVAFASDLARHVRGLRPSALEREVKALRGQVGELSQELAAETRARLAFQEIAHKWFARVASLERARSQNSGPVGND